MISKQEIIHLRDKLRKENPDAELVVYMRQTDFEVLVSDVDTVCPRKQFTHIFDFRVVISADHREPLFVAESPQKDKEEPIAE